MTKVLSMTDKMCIKIKKEKIAHSFVIPKIVSQMFKETRGKKYKVFTFIKTQRIINQRVPFLPNEIEKCFKNYYCNDDKNMTLNRHFHTVFMEDKI